MTVRAIATSLTCIVGVGIGLAADDPISDRRRLMQDNGRTENKVNQLILGKFFPERAIAAMQKIEANMAIFPNLFPEGSESGGETHASPDIWTNREDFQAMAEAVIASVKAAEASVADGQAAFSTAWQNVSVGCAACHAKYAPKVGAM